MFADPVQGNGFFDRQTNLDLMKKRVNGLTKGYRQNVALVGPELIGKSSLLLQLVHELGGDEKIFPIYFEVRDEDLHRFCKRFTAAILYYYFRQEGEITEDVFEKANEKFPRTTERILRIEKLFGKKSRDQILSSIFDLLPILCEEGGRLCIMILDEFQELGSLNARNPFAILGEKIMAQKEVMYIVASSKVRRANEILSNELALLFGSFEVDKLGPFSVDKGLQFIGKKLDGILMDRACAKFLVSMTNGHPFYLDSFCRALRNVANERSIKEVRRNVVAEVVSREVFNSRSIVYQCMDGFLNHSLNNHVSQGLEILLAIANGNKKSSQIARIISRSTAQTVRKLEKLVSSGVIMKRGRVYDFCDPLLKWWIKSVYCRRKEAFEPVVEGDGEFDLQGQIEELIALHIVQEKIGPGERLRRLFSLFRNEVVEIEGKMLKLPKFNNICSRVVRGQDLPVVACVGKTYWVGDFSKTVVSDRQVRAFLDKLSGFRGKIGRKLLVCLAGIDADAKLLAKEESICLWDLGDLNFVLELYDQPRMSCL